MKLTRASTYALHAVVFMAAQKQNQNQPIASHIIARARGIPERFLLKVLKPLVSVRLLTSVKGPNGGYRLARPASKITMLEVIEAVDGPIRGLAPLAETSQGGIDPRLQAICNHAADRLLATELLYTFQPMPRTMAARMPPQISSDVWDGRALKPPRNPWSKRPSRSASRLV